MRFVRRLSVGWGDVAPQRPSTEAVSEWCAVAHVAALAAQEGRACMKIGVGLFLLLIGIFALVFVFRRQAITSRLPGRNEVAGKLKQDLGAVQEAAGRAAGNDQLAAEGQARQVEGTAQEAVGKVQ
jgi:uncharacterized protein YjbJ (UPF0337 family)